MKKRIILVSFLFLLCGCSANVNINLTENGISETVSITATENSSITKSQIKDGFREFVPAFGENVIVDTMPDQKEVGIKYYERTMSELSNGYNFTYKYAFNLNNYVKAKTVKDGFRSAAVQYDKDEDTITLSTDNGGILFFNQYPDLEQIKVNITSEYDVKESNADYVTGSVYTWVFTPDTKKSIYILYDVSQGSTVGNNGASSNNNNNNNNDPANSNNKNQVSNVTNTKKEKTGIDKFINDHPVLIALAVLALFLIFVIILTKFSKR